MDGDRGIKDRLFAGADDGVGGFDLDIAMAGMGGDRRPNHHRGGKDKCRGYPLGAVHRTETDAPALSHR